MKKSNEVNYSMRINVKNRRKKVIERLENQLKSGVKRNHLRKVDNFGLTPLNEFDIQRINKELNILKSRI